MASLPQSTKRRGQSLVEIVIAMGLSTILIPAVYFGLITSRQAKSSQQQRISAMSWLRETVEATRQIRETDWNTFAVNNTYHPELSGNVWIFVPGTQTQDGLTRSVTISDVRRDTSGNIIASGGTIDTSTKRADFLVSWSSPIFEDVVSTEYFTRYVGNSGYTQTSLADFTSGTLSNTAVVNTAGGEVALAANTKGKWCEPFLSAVTIDLPGAPLALYSVEGHIFAATGTVANASTVSFAHVVVGNSDPPSFSLHGIVKGYKSNAAFGEELWGYFATSNDTREVVIVNLNQYDDVVNKIYHQEGYFNTPGSSIDANTIFVMNNRGYVTAGNYLYVFDLTAKNGARNQIGTRIQFANSGDKAGEIYGRVVDGHTYIYIAIIGSTVEEMKIADVTNNNISSQWRIVGSINIEPNNCSSLESGQAVFVNPGGSRAYVSSVNDTNFKEFFVIDTSNKTSPSLVGGFASNPPCTNGGGYEAGGMNPEQSVVVSLAENRAILVGTDAANDAVNSEEYQVLDLTSEAAPVRCGGLQFDQGIYGVGAVKEADGDAYAYLITGDTGNELRIVQGGPDGNYSESGTYESAIFDAGHSVAFNRLFTTTDLPAGTSLTFQVAAADPVSGSCSGAVYNYVGPDGTSATSFPATGGQIPLSNDGTGFENPAQCLRYKANLMTTNYSNTPLIYDVVANYSP
jgi:hypothetical protein